MVPGDLTDAQGGFYSAEDADSEGEEGRFYLWAADELEKLLGRRQAEKWASIFNVSPAGNYTDEASGRRTGANILHLTKPFVTHLACARSAPNVFAGETNVRRARNR